MFRTAAERGAAEAVLRTGVAAKHWQATGLALIVDRLDEILDLLEASALASTDRAEVNR